jgi:hypothetical protein
MVYGVYNVDFFMFMSCYFYPRYLGRDQKTKRTQVTFLNSTMEAVGINSLQKRTPFSVTSPD